MGKLLCDSVAAVAAVPAAPPPATSVVVLPSLHDTDAAAEVAWGAVAGLEEQQRRGLERLRSSGVLWKLPGSDVSSGFRLSHGGEVEADGNCLFTACRRAMGTKLDASDLRRRTVVRFLGDLEVGRLDAAALAGVIRNMYCPDLKVGWGIHVVQEVKLLARKEEREGIDLAIQELVDLGLQRYIRY